jgi:hypothetical protein
MSLMPCLRASKASDPRLSKTSPNDVGETPCGPRWKAEAEKIKKARLYWAIRELKRIEVAGGEARPRRSRCYLFAIHRESGVGEDVEDPWFTGYETEPRWMRLKKSGTELQCVKEGFVLRPPPAPAYAEVFSQVCAEHGVGGDHVLLVPQVECDGRKRDTRDRVQLGAALLRDLVKAGL